MNFEKYILLYNLKLCFISFIPNFSKREKLSLYQFTKKILKNVWKSFTGTECL